MAPFINLGTPKSKDNHMHRYLYDDAYADSWTRLHFTWRDAVKEGEAYSPAAAIIGFDESAMIRKKTNIPENIQREWDAEVYVKNKRKPASEDAWK